MTSQYPNSIELRDWAMGINPNAVDMRGRLPRGVVLAWNKAHPDRPYVASQSHHGTVSGYRNKGCRCDRCCIAGPADTQNFREAERTFGESA